MESSRPTFDARTAISARLSRLARLVLIAAFGLATAACGGGGGGDGDSGGGTTNPAPRANFTATPTAGAAPLQVAFDGSGSSDSNGSIASYAWTFGDGGTATGVTTQHTYQTPGTYTATLVVTDNQGATSAPFSRTIDARAPGGLAVTVRDDLNALVANATVSATVGGTTKQATTDASGVATIGDLPLGSATIDVSKASYIGTTVTANVLTGQTTTVNAKIQRRVGSLVVTVVESTFKDPIAGALVRATSDGRLISATTGTSGIATLSGIPTGQASLVVTAAGFEDAAPRVQTIVEGENAPITIELSRTTSTAAGFSGGEAVVSAGTGGTELQLTLRFVVIDQDSQPVTTLTAGSFALQPCNEEPNTNDCVRGLSPALDGSYAVVGQDATKFAKLAGNPTPSPFAAALLFDQSKSVGSTDPTDARVFAGKIFLDSVESTGSDWVSLGAFADDYPDTNNGPYLLPGVPPLHVYPPGFTQEGGSLAPALESFPDLESGDTPFYAALDDMIAYFSTSLPPAAAASGKAVVVFSDAVDNDPACPSEQVCRNATISQAVADNVRVFTIGLSASPNVRVTALAELAEGTGGAFLLAPDAAALIPIYGSLGNLLNGTLLQYQTVWTIRSPTTDAFKAGYFVSGEMDITTGSGVITVPFVVPVSP